MIFTSSRGKRLLDISMVGGEKKGVLRSTRSCKHGEMKAIEECLWDVIQCAARLVHTSKLYTWEDEVMTKMKKQMMEIDVLGDFDEFDRCSSFVSYVIESPVDLSSSASVGIQSVDIASASHS